MHEISPTELQQRLDTDAAPPVLLDVREPWEIERARLPRALCIPMRDLPARLQELQPDCETVVLCHHGIRSRSACLLLERCGFTKVRNLTGGIDAWARQIEPAMPIY